MRKGISISLFVCIILVFNSCDNSIDINAEFQEETFIYGLLQIDAPEQYIRIQKNYLGEDISALTLAEDPSNTYYHVEDILVEMSPEGQDDYLALVADTLPKEPGTFSSSGNIIYRYTEPLTPDKDYKIRVTDLSTGKTTTATTTVVQNFQLQIPPEGSSTYTMEFNNKAPYGFNEKMEFLSTQPKGAKLFNIKLRIHYIEHRTDGPKDTVHTDITIRSNHTVSNVNSGQAVSILYEGQNVLSTFLRKLATDQEITYELLPYPAEFIVECAGEAYWDYYRVNVFSQTGITALEATPIYTNVENGAGLFSSRLIKHRPNIKFDEKSMQYLFCQGAIQGVHFSTPQGFLPNCP